MQMRSGLISIGKLDTIASPRGPICTFESTLYFLVPRWNIELKTSKHEFTDISHQNKQGFEGKKLRGTNFTATECVPDYSPLGEFEAKILTVFLPLFSRWFRLLSSKILQNNLLDLYLVEIRRYKLSFFAKAATKFFPTKAPFLLDLKKSFREAQNS